MVGLSDGLSYHGDGDTPVDPNEVSGLLPTWVATLADLNDAEARNIARARLRWERRRPGVQMLLSDLTLRRLHRDMFGDVWRWAGTYRRRELSIGMDPLRVAGATRELCLDAAFWFSPHPDAERIDRELARFHHRLVVIHPFQNGNGRLGRYATDLLATATGAARPRWGGLSPDRAAYLGALRHADDDPDDLGPLAAFLRS